jgi:hypothetical protein
MQHHTAHNPQLSHGRPERHSLPLPGCRTPQFLAGVQGEHSQEACIQWFQETYGHKVSQSTISESLSATFKRLDTEAGAVSTSALRIRSGFWPELEEVLWHWQLRIEANGALHQMEKSVIE